MAVKKKVVEIDTGQAQKSVKQMRDQLKLLKDQLVSLDQDTQEYNQTLQEAANIQHNLKEMNEQLAASAMDFGQIMTNTTNTIGGVVSGFQTLTASMSLMGIENKDALESIKKLQAIMALTQGIQGIEKGIKSFKNLVNVISNSTAVAKLFNSTTNATATAETATATATKGLQGAMVGEAAATGTATVATKAFKKALISTGIGAIVVAIGTLIAHLEDLSKWLGLGNNKAEEHKKAIANLEAQYSDFNSTLKQNEYFMKDKERMYKDELKAMDDNINKMKAEGASDAALLAEQEKNLARRKEIANEQLRLVQWERDDIKEAYADITKSVNGFAENLNKNNVYTQLAAYSKILENEKTYLKQLEDSDASDDLINKSKKYITQYEQMLKLLNDYIKNLESEDNIRNNVLDREKSIQNERIANLRKLKEEYVKFNQSLELDGLKNKEKELKQTENAEKERLKTLKKYRQEGAITRAEYEKKVTEITELYSQQRLEIEAKYAEQESKKRIELYKKQADLEKKALEDTKKLQELAYKEEAQENENLLNARAITIEEYYNREKALAEKQYQERFKLANEEYTREAALIEQQLAEKADLLGQVGLSEETRNQLAQEMNQLTAQLLSIENDYNIKVAELADERQQIELESDAAIFESRIEYMTAMKDQVVEAMDAITGIGEGISSEWATAFDTMSTGIINFAQNLKTTLANGKADWKDYANVASQLAASAFAAGAALMKGLADEQDANSKEGFEKQKKYQIAAATMSMLAGVTAALSGLFTTKSGPWDIALAAIQAGIITATGIAQIVKIKQQKFEGGSSASASPSTGAMSNIIAPVQYTQDVQGAEIEGAIKDSKVYVVESDITDAQDKVEVAESEARY